MAYRDKYSVDEWMALARTSSYSAEQLARQIKVSRRQLERYTQERFGASPQRWLNEQRMAAAALLLKEQRSIKEVAYSMGFKQLSHFSREFKLHHGLPPRAYLGALRRQ